MTARALLRLMACGVALGFLGDLLRRCWVVQAWNVGAVASVLLVVALIATRRAWRAARRRRLPADFVRPNTPDFPEQPRRGIR